MNYKHKLFAFLFGFLSLQAQAQTDSVKKISYSFLPFVITDPFIGLGYGATSNVNFLLGSPSTTRFSNAQAYVIKTTKGQFATQLSHQIFTKNETWMLQGKMQYSDWPESTYGLGAHTSNDELVDKEIVSYKAIEFEERVMKQIRKSHFLGLHYRMYDCWSLHSNNDSTGFFEQFAIGSKKFTASTIGVHYVFDNRDNVQNAYDGKYAELTLNPYFKLIGSTEDWFNARLDARSYKMLKTKRHAVLAQRMVAELAAGDVPYMIMPQAGRLNTTRGYAQGRYRGKLFLNYEAEMRVHLWKIIGGVVFGGVHTLTEPNDKIKYLNPNVGAGLRFNINKSQRTNIRVDYALGLNQNSGLYFQICEVF